MIIFVLQEIEMWKGTFLNTYPDVNLERDQQLINEQFRTNLKSKTLDKTHPKLVEEWNYEKNGNLLPSMFYAGSDEKVWWKCNKCGHEWKTSIGHRTSGTGCNLCYRKQNKGRSHKEAKCVYQYKLDGTFIKKWDCISDVGRELKINTSNISMCANHKRQNAGGYRWEYQHFEKLEPLVKK